MSKENLKKLIRAVGEDPQMRKRFQADPEAVMEEHDVAEEHREMLRNKDKEGLSKAAGVGDAHMNLMVL